MKGPVVQLVTSLMRGGAETQVVLLARTLRECGWDVRVVSLIDGCDFPEERGALSLGMRPGVADPRGAARLMSILRRIRPAVLHSHLFHANLLARLVRPIFPIPRVINTLHSVAESRRDSTDYEWRDRLYRWTHFLGDETVGVSSVHATRRVIPNGVDTEQFHPVEDLNRDRFVWLAAGRIMWKKDYPALLRAFARLRNCELWIAGSGQLEAAPPPNVRLLGQREDMPDLMRSVDALVLSSVVEGLPMVLLEAAASGLPCVSTRAGGAADAVEDGVTGFLVPCGDDAALAASMTRVMEMTPAERAAMGQRARARSVERFDRHVVAAQWEDLYRGA